MKRNIKLAVVVICMLFGLSFIFACYSPISNHSRYVTTSSDLRVEISVARLDMTLGIPLGEYAFRQRLTATVLPAGESQEVAWTSGNPAVAQVDAGGIVTALSAGTTTITATMADNSAISSYIPIVVSAPLPTGITVLPASNEATPIQIGVGMLRNFSAYISPHLSPQLSPYIDQRVTWEIVSGEDYIFIAPDGTVTAVEPGHAQIMATSLAENADGENFIAYAFIQVMPISEELIPSTDRLYLFRGDVYRVFARPTYGAVLEDDEIFWDSSNPDIPIRGDGTIIIDDNTPAGVSFITAMAGWLDAEIMVTVLDEDKPEGAISTPADWKRLTGSSADPLDLSRDYFLVNDIDFGGETLASIGANETAAADATPPHAFNGTLDGRGHTLRHANLGGSVTFSNTNQSFGSGSTNWVTGFFGGTTTNAVIRNIAVEYVNGHPNGMNASLFVGHNRGVIENVSITKSVLSNNIAAAATETASWNSAGAFFGRNNGTVRNVVVHNTGIGVNIRLIGGDNNSGYAPGVGSIINTFGVIDTAFGRGQLTTAQWHASNGGTQTNTNGFLLSQIHTINFSALPFEFWEGGYNTGAEQLPTLIRLDWGGM